MGRDGVQRQAITELLALPMGHPMKQQTIEHLSMLQISLSMGQNLDRDERALSMNLTPVYEQWRKETLQEGRQIGIQEGEQRGRQIGIQEGQREGELNFALRLLTRRFGTIAPETEAQVRGLSLQQLTELGDALLDFSQLSDLQDWLQAHSRSIAMLPSIDDILDRASVGRSLNGCDRRAK